MFDIIRAYYGNFGDMLVVMVFFVFSVLSALILHEFAHAWVALKCGDPSAKFGGRLTLNPAKHLDPVGALLFVFIGIGWAKPVPINPNNFRNLRRGTFLVSIAGVVTNLIIGFVASLFYALFWQSGIWALLPMYLMVVHISFAVFNLLPIPPLDGFNLLTAAAPHSSAVRFLRQNSMMMLLVLLLVIQFTGFTAIIRNGIINMFLGFWGLFF